MSDATELHVSVQLTPEQIAEAWWNLGSDRQAAFYAHLNRIAGVKLCFQSAAIIDEIARTDNRDAQLGFNTIHAHAVEYLTTATEIRAGNAVRGIARMADAARATH